VTDARLSIRTRPVDTDAALLDLLPTGVDPMSWVVRGEGLVGWGEAAAFVGTGATRFADADRWLRALAEQSDVADEVRVPGTGLVAFASFAFADEPSPSLLVVPKVLVGRRDGRTWVTTVSCEAKISTQEVASAPTGLRFGDGYLSVAEFQRVIEKAIAHIHEGELYKVVLAHDLLATAAEPIDQRYVLQRLAASYPDCWTYAVAGLVGATPEMLITRSGSTVTARLLAGTVWPGAESSLSSLKNRAEHQYAIDSLSATLSPLCKEISVPAEPTVLRLHNVSHLASEVTGTLAAPLSLTQLAAHVHPTAAVGGTPTASAVKVIAELEGFDRGRYAGPVGWIDANGDGELGLALRCATIDGNTARLFAGCGIVSDSDPVNEAAEAEAKFRPVRDALLSP
jgi:menaquinone-specific isochorismate synthase